MYEDNISSEDDINLPEVHKTHDQERRSIRAFRDVMEDGNFIVRDVRAEDYGVDLSLEIKINRKYASNFKVSIQMKDVLNSQKIIKEDKSYSYPVSIKNINYLSNQPNSLYMIYLENENKIIWDWVYEIEKAIIQKEINLNKPKQQKFNYRFNKTLDEEAKKEIYNQSMHIGKSISHLAKYLIDNIKKVNILNVFKRLRINETKVISAVSRKIELAEKYLEQDKIYEALKIYCDISKVVDEEGILLKCAYLHIATGQYIKGINKCKLSLSKNHKNYKTYLFLGISYEELKRYDKAIKYFNKSLEFCKTPVGYIELGRVWFIQGDVYKSIEYIRKALMLENICKEEFIEAEILLALIYTNVFNMTKAMKYAHSVLSKDSDNAMAFALIGENYMNMGENQKAIHYFDKSLDYDKINYYALLGLSLIYFQSDIGKGINYFHYWIKEYLKDIIIKSAIGNTILMHIGWEKTSIIMLSYERDNTIKIHFSEDMVIPINIDDEGGKIAIGWVLNENNNKKIALVGKIYNKSRDFNRAIDNIKKRIRFVEDFFYDGKQSIDFDNKTKLYIEEGEDRIYIKLNFNGYIIQGVTNSDSGKEEFKKFVEYYNKNKFFQVDFYDEESRRELYFIVRNNADIRCI